MIKSYDNSEEFNLELEKKETIYLIVFYYDYCIVNYKWTGKYTEDNIPIVYNYYDGNGCCDCFIEQPITDVTTGFIQGWTFDYNEALNKLKECKK